jgi:hypothetical protein
MHLLLSVDRIDRKWYIIFRNNVIFSLSSLLNYLKLHIIMIIIFDFFFPISIDKILPKPIKIN